VDQPVDPVVQPRLGQGIEEDQVSTIDRPEGKQLTLAGWPLYYYAPAHFCAYAGVTCGSSASAGANRASVSSSSVIRPDR
jgi:hypothetical protein